MNFKIRQKEKKTFSFLSHKPVDPGLLTQSNMFFPDFNKWEGMKAHQVLHGLLGHWLKGRFVINGSYSCGFILGKNISEKKKHSQNARGRSDFDHRCFCLYFLISVCFWFPRLDVKLWLRLIWVDEHIYTTGMHYIITSQIIGVKLWMLELQIIFLSYTDNSSVMR